MFPTHSPQQASIAAQLRDELLAYGAGMDRFVAQWDMQLYRELCDRFDRIQMYAEALPRLSASFTELLISRVELLHALWDGVPARVVAKHAAHAQRVRELLHKLERYVAEPAE
jgi:hypothetical protein